MNKVSAQLFWVMWYRTLLFCTPNSKCSKCASLVRRSAEEVWDGKPLWVCWWLRRYNCHYSFSWLSQNRSPIMDCQLNTYQIHTNKVSTAVSGHVTPSFPFLHSKCSQCSAPHWISEEVWERKILWVLLMVWVIWLKLDTIVITQISHNGLHVNSTHARFWQTTLSTRSRW